MSVRVCVYVHVPEGVCVCECKVGVAGRAGSLPRRGVCRRTAVNTACGLVAVSLTTNPLCSLHLYKSINKEIH